MQFTAKPVSVEDISRWRDLYRLEMRCQIVHDSLHPRPGWTQPYLLESAGVPVGYGSLVIGGPWAGTRTLFEFYVAPQHRSHTFDLFDTLRTASQADAIKVQTNDPILTVLFHLHARDVQIEKIVFEDKVTTALSIHNAVLRRIEGDDERFLDVNNEQVAKGGVLYHYNRPYGDIYMEVAEAHRRQGYGAYIVQQLKRLAYETGNIPCARTSPENIASRKTLQRAGFVPCALILEGKLETE